jgi:dTDP-4-dehydrorhamnose reductase
VRLLVVGASGYLGTQVCRGALASGWPVVGTYLRAPGPDPRVNWVRLDVRDRAAVYEVVAAARPTAIVHTAYQYADWEVTADGAAHVATAAAEAGARLVHLSSDIVHGGRSTPYGDDEPPSPATVYGAAKAAAETAVRLVAPTAAIVRTSLIVGSDASQQVRLCLDMIEGRVPGALFVDEIRCPVDVGDLAQACLELAGNEYAGRINVAGPEAVSRAELGRIIAVHHGLDPERVPVTTIAGSGLVRSAQIRLDVTRAGVLLRTPLRGIRQVYAGPR